MFKRYQITLKADKNEPGPVIDFYVNSKGTRRGFMHRAIAIGCLPKREGSGLYSPYPPEIHRARYHRISYTNRTWEEWSGQTCLTELWEKIMKCGQIEKDRFPEENPFREGIQEPAHVCLPEPESIFRRD